MSKDASKCKTATKSNITTVSTYTQTSQFNNITSNSFLDEDNSYMSTQESSGYGDQGSSVNIDNQDSDSDSIQNNSNSSQDIDFKYEFNYDEISSTVLKKKYLDTIVSEIVNIFKRYGGKNSIKLFLAIKDSNLIAKRIISAQDLKKEEFFSKNNHLIQAYKNVETNGEKKSILSIIQLEDSKETILSCLPQCTKFEKII